MSTHDIQHTIEEMLDRYFADLDGQPPCALHAMVMNAVERPLLACVLRRADGNQTAAAQMLGINRNTLRRKLEEHQLR